MSIITIVLFFIYSWGLGYSVSRFFKNSDNFFERNFMRIGIGLSTIPFLGLLLSFLHIPLDWRLFVFLSLALPIYDVIKNKKILSNPIKFVKSDLYIAIILLLFFSSLFMFS